MQCNPCPIPNKFCWCELHPDNKSVIKLKLAPDVNIKLELIKGIIAKKYNISKRELVSPSRKKHIVHARYIAFYVCRRSTGATLAEIGKSFKRKHHVVLHGIDKIRGSRELLDEAKIILLNIR